MGTNGEIIVWLRRKGFSETGNPANPIPRYEVVKAQNTVHPRVMDILEEEEVQSFINSGYVVYIGK